jgi:hypothetical protein
MGLDKLLLLGDVTGVPADRLREVKVVGSNQPKLVGYVGVDAALRQP